MPRISVIVPVYKVEKYIHHCIDSILGQAFIDSELILVDDGSPDNRGAICDEKYRLTLRQCADYIETPLLFIWLSAIARSMLIQ